MMGWLKRGWWWLRARLDSDHVRWTIEEDIRTHIELDAERLRAEGMPPEAALKEAKRRFGDRNKVQAEMLRIASAPPTDGAALSIAGVWAYLRHATRALWRTPGPSALMVGVLAATVGVATLMLSVTQTVLLGSGGVEEPSLVMSLHTYFPELPDGLRQQPLGGAFVAPLEAVEDLAALAAFKSSYFILTGHGDPQRLDGLLTTPGLFDVAGVTPLMGTGFDRATKGDERIVVVSWSLWNVVFGGDPGILGTTLVLNDEPYEVVGVMPAGFEFPRAEDVPPTFRYPDRPDIWVPHRPPIGGPMELGMVARLRDGLAAEDLGPRLDAVVASLVEQWGQDPGFSIRAVPIQEQATGGVRPVFSMLLIATGLVLLVAMANVTGVGVARTEVRMRELAVRVALGAGRRGALAYLAAESAVLAAAAALVGVGVATALAAAVRAAAPPGVPGIEQVRVGIGSIGVATLLAMLGASCLALGPAVGMIRWRLADALKGFRSTASLSNRRVGNAVVALELAATLVLVAGASVLTRSALNLLDVDTGFDARGVMTAEVTLPESTYPELSRAAAVQGATWPMPDGAAVPRFQREAIGKLEALPGIVSAAFANPLPFSGGQEASVFWAEGMEATDQTPLTEYTVVTEGYFRTMGIRVLEGREFDEGETGSSEPVAVVSRSLADMFPSGDALGRRIKLGGTPDARYPWLRVVGVVDDVRRTDLTTPGRPELYVHVSQGGYTPQSTSRLLVRVSPGSDPRTAFAAMRSAFEELDTDVPVNAPASMEDLVAEAAARGRFTALLTAGFSVLALLITALGLYSAISFGAATRRRELALRTVLGATGPGIAKAVLADTLGAVAVGLALGLAGAVASAHTLSALLFGVGPLDPVLLAIAVVLLSFVVVVAAQGPVRACLRLEPSRILSRD